MRVLLMFSSVLVLLFTVQLAAQNKMPVPPGFIPPRVSTPPPSPPVQGQSTTSTSDPQAVAVVQAAITAIGGAAAIGTLQSWTFKAQATGRIANGPITGVLASTISQTTQPSGKTAKMPPPWARPRSLLVPALVSAILAKQSQDPTVLLTQGAASASAPNASAVIFSTKGKSGAAPTQRWYFDNTSGLPNRIDFLLPAKVGPVEAFAGTVLLSNYQSVGGILYPFKIVAFLQSPRAMETITLQSVTPSTAASASTPVASNMVSGTVSGGAQ